MLSVAVGEAGMGHAFTEDFLFEKIFFKAKELPVDKVVGLVD